jgi:hypothetical protein
MDADVDQGGRQPTTLARHPQQGDAACSQFTPGHPSPLLLLLLLLLQGENFRQDAARRWKELRSFALADDWFTQVGVCGGGGGVRVG